jgi:antitoxin ParD1/3/4
MPSQFILIEELRSGFMPTMNISLPENLKEFVESQVRSGDFSSVSEFIRLLVRREQRERDREKLELRILEGLGSGEATEVTPQMWGEIRQRLRERRAKQD